MELGRTAVLVALLLPLFLGCSTAVAFGHASDVLLNCDGMTSRHLLQQKTSCTADFKNANYTGIISKCKAPKYPVTSCCPPFKELICLYRDYLNDLNSNCSYVMFSYLNKQGGYPAGLFSNMCRDDKDGFNCTGFPSINDESSSNTAAATKTITSDGDSVSPLVFFFVVINLVGTMLAFTFF